MFICIFLNRESDHLTPFMQPPPISVTLTPQGVSPGGVGGQFTAPTPGQQLLGSKLTTAPSPLQTPSLVVPLTGAPLYVNPLPMQHRHGRHPTLPLPKLAVSFV